LPPAEADLDALLTARFDDPALRRLSGARAAALPSWMLGRTLFGPAGRFLRVPGKRVRAELVQLGWTLGGAAGPCPALLADAAELLHAGALIVDDIQDAATTRRGRPALHRTIGVPLALNAGNWLFFWPLERLSRLPFDDATALALHRRIVQVVARCHVGQALDLGLAIDTLRPCDVAPAVRAITELKTGSLTGLAVALGAVAAGASARRAGALERFGQRLGVGLQMLNDLADLEAPRGARYRDLRAGRVTWPWAWLSRRLEPAAYRGFRSRARAVVRDGDAASALGRAIRARVGAYGRRMANAWLVRAGAAARTHVGPHPAIDDAVRRVQALHG
jgi:geranylgeranyl pyrophosphate synthase